MFFTRVDDFVVDSFFLFDSRASDRLKTSIDKARFVVEIDKNVDQTRKRKFDRDDRDRDRDRSDDEIDFDDENKNETNSDFDDENENENENEIDFDFDDEIISISSLSRYNSRESVDTVEFVAQRKIKKNQILQDRLRVDNDRILSTFSNHQFVAKQIDLRDHAINSRVDDEIREIHRLQQIRDAIAAIKTRARKNKKK